MEYWQETMENLIDLTAPAYTAVSSEQIERVARFVGSHPGFYAGHNGRGVVIQVESVQVDTGEQWTEYCSVWSIRGARDVLGY